MQQLCWYPGLWQQLNLSPEKHLLVYTVLIVLRQPAHQDVVWGGAAALFRLFIKPLKVPPASQSDEGTYLRQASKNIDNPASMA